MSKQPGRMHWLETRLPPPILMVLLGVAALAMTRVFPSPSFDWPLLDTFALALALSGAALNLLPKRGFRQAGTTLNPMRPEASTALVTSGIYRFSRNPMYLGHATILLGWSLYLRSPLALLAPVVFMLYLTRFQIRPEERQLLARFPEAYAAYCATVRRWL